MKKTALMIGITTALAISSSAAFAGIANVSQKGSLLIFPKIDVRENTTTWVRLVNDGNSPVQVKCYFMDINKNRNDMEFSLTIKDALVLVVADEDASPQPKPKKAQTVYFPSGPGIGELVCFAVTETGTALRNYNNLGGTATVAKNGVAVEYSAWGFRANGSPTGDLDLNGTEYDSCPAFLFGQISPKGSPAPTGSGDTYGNTYINISSCKQDLKQDWTYNVTKLSFDIWDWNEFKLTGAWECANSYFEDYLDGIDVSPRFTYAQLKAYGYYRVSGIPSTKCDTKYRDPLTGAYVKSAATGLVGVQTTYMAGDQQAVAVGLGASESAAVPGFVKWDASLGITGGK